MGQVKSELDDMQEIIHRERDDLMERIRELTREIRMKRGEGHKSLAIEITNRRLNFLNILYPGKVSAEIKYFDLGDNPDESLGTRVEITLPVIK